MPDRISASRTDPRFQSVLLGSRAVVALLLALAGLCGSLAHPVGRRQRELGVRMALGAARVSVLRLVASQGMKVVAVGLVLGITGSYWSSRVLSGFLFGVEPNDPLTLLGVSGLLLLVGAVACWIPARRATAVDPVRVLRAE